MSGMLRAYAGDVETAIDHLKRSRRLNPLGTGIGNFGFVLAYFVAGNYDEVVNWSAEV